MTPLGIGIMLHYHCSPVDFRDGDFSAPAVRDTIDAFKGDMGLLRENDGTTHRESAYIITDRGTAFVNALCSLPLPVVKWVMPEGS